MLLLLSSKHDSLGVLQLETVSSTKAIPSPLYYISSTPNESAQNTCQASPAHDYRPASRHPPGQGLVVPCKLRRSARPKVRAIALSNFHFRVLTSPGDVESHASKSCMWLELHAFTTIHPNSYRRGTVRHQMRVKIVNVSSPGELKQCHASITGMSTQEVSCFATYRYFKLQHGQIGFSISQLDIEGPKN